jgi:hypothetical protein
MTWWTRAVFVAMAIVSQSLVVRALAATGSNTVWSGVRPPARSNPALLAMLLSAVFVMILTMAPLRDFFELSLLGLADWVVLAGVTGIWVLAVHRAWRARVLERLVA